MGEYFAWVNVSKRERLAMGAFTPAFKAVEPCWVGNKDVDAVCTLLSGRWKGDLVAFCGDESCNYWPDTSEEAQRAREEDSPVFLDYAEDAYKDITGVFKEAKGLTYTDYGTDVFVEIPYSGPFDTTIEHRRYVVNHTKRLCYDRERTPIRCVWPHHLGGNERIVRFDPFPALFEKDSRLDVICEHTNEFFKQDWVGDSVEVTDDEPPKDYLDVSTFYNYWTPSLVVDDETLIAAMESDEYGKLQASGVDDMKALKLLLPEHVIRGSITAPCVWPIPEDQH